MTEFVGNVACSYTAAPRARTPCTEEIESKIHEGHGACASLVVDVGHRRSVVGRHYRTLLPRRRAASVWRARVTVRSCWQLTDEMGIYLQWRNGIYLPTLGSSRREPHRESVYSVSWGRQAPRGTPASEFWGQSHHRRTVVAACS